MRPKFSLSTIAGALTRRSQRDAAPVNTEEEQQDKSDWFQMPALPSIPGAMPRHKFELPDEPGPASKDDDASQAPPPAPDSHIIEGKARYITNPVKFGFLFTVGVGIALLCYFFISNVGALAGWLTGAVFIGLGLDPAVRKLEKWGLPRAAGVTAVFVFLGLLATAIIFWLIPTIARQAVTFINGFPEQFENFLNSDFFSTIDDQYQIRQNVDTEVEKFFSNLTSDGSAISSFFSSLMNAGTTIAQIATGIIIVLFLSIYVLASLPTIKAWGVRLAPASKRERVGYLTEEITSSVGQYVMGQAIVALLNASFAFIVMLIVGVPFPQLLMLFVLILAFIPLVGGVSAAVLVSLVSLIDSWQTAVFFLIPYIIYLQFEAYFVSPRIMSKAVAVPGAIAVIAVAAGSALWGVLGALIAIPVAASLLILVREVLIPHQDKR